jgi:hypothetical protein
VTDFQAAALELAAQGTAVFPVGADKAPRTPRGFHDASTNPETIAAWDWNGGGMIGAAIAPGRVVIDVDPRNGGNETLKLLREQYGKLPPTRVVRTRSGGFHYYFTIPEDVELRAHLGGGIDVKRSGRGYVVVPPSPGYYDLGDREPAEAPAWLLDELRVDTSTRAAGEAGPPRYFPWQDATDYGTAALERELGRLATAREGGRNDALNRAAFALAQLSAGGELDEARARDELALAAERMGLEPRESRATIDSGWSAGEAEPRQAPPRDAPAPTPSATPAGNPEAGEAGDSVRWVDWRVDEPEPPFILRPILPRNAYVLVYGATEASKSMVWNALGAQASHEGYRVSVYSLENPPATDRDRLRRLAPNPARFRLTNEPIDLNDARQLAELVERERAWEDGSPTDIVVIDTYSHAFASRSEDGNAKAIEFARRIRHLMHEVGCSVVLIDHTGYQQAEEPRDASAKRQQVDVGVLMTKAGEWRPGQPARFTMKCTKSARFGNPFYLTGEIRDTANRGLELGWMSAEPPRWEEPES